MISPNKKPTISTVKFLCSYGGRIIPRPSDGLLRYVGGHTRVVSVHRFVSYSQLIEKLSDMCGHRVALRCQLPGEELDVLISIKSDEDVASIIDEYDRASSLLGKQLKIRSILSPTKPPPPSNSNISSPLSSASSCANLSPTKSSNADCGQLSRSTAPNLLPRPVSNLRSGSATGCTQYVPYRDRVRFQPCHVQAHYRPLVHNSIYRQ